MNSSRLESIDVARGLAAVSVAVYHHNFADVLAQASGWTGFEAIAIPGARLAVPLFFVISGYCIHLGAISRPASAWNARDFFLQRFFRIYPPWVVALLVSAFALWLEGRPPHSGLWLSHLTLTNGFFDDYRFNAALWSVSVESMLYLIYPFWLTVRRRYGLTVAALVALLVSVLSSVVTALLFAVPTGPSQWFFLNVWIGWVAGAILAERYRDSQGKWLARPAWWIVGVLGWGAHLLLLQTHSYRGGWAFAELPILITLCIWPLGLLMVIGEKIAQGRSPIMIAAIWRTFAGIGVFSYSLYLLHMPLQSIRLVFNAQLSGTVAKACLFLGWFGLVLGVAWLSHRWIEVPSVRWGRRLADRLRPLASPIPAARTA